MTTTIDTTALFFGAPASLTVGGDEVGATLNPPKVMVQATQYAPDFQGAGGPVSGAVFNTKIKASVEFDVNELTAAKLAWSLPGSSPAAGTGSVTAGPNDFATTLTADIPAGVTLIPVADTTDGGSSVEIAPGMFLKIGTGDTAEFRKVRDFAPGVAIELTESLFFAHETDEDVVRVDDLDTTVITWRIGRVPSAAFKDVVIDGEGLDGRHLVVTVNDALSDGNLEVEMSDSAVAGSHVVMTGYYDGSDPTLCPVQISVGAGA